jgi:hypothetical protein
MKPSIGRIVQVFTRGEWRPALVTRVHSDTCINASIFSDDGEAVDRKTSLVLNEAEQELAWRWPPRA